MVYDLNPWRVVDRRDGHCLLLSDSASASEQDGYKDCEMPFHSSWGGIGWFIFRGDWRVLQHCCFNQHWQIALSLTRTLHTKFLSDRLTEPRCSGRSRPS